MSWRILKQRDSVNATEQRSTHTYHGPCSRLLSSILSSSRDRTVPVHPRVSCVSIACRLPADHHATQLSMVICRTSVMKLSVLTGSYNRFKFTLDSSSNRSIMTSLRTRARKLLDTAPTQRKRNVKSKGNKRGRSSSTKQRQLW